VASRSEPTEKRAERIQHTALVLVRLVTSVAGPRQFVGVKPDGGHLSAFRKDSRMQIFNASFSAQFTAKDFNDQHSPSSLTIAYRSLSSSDEKMSAYLSLSPGDRDDLFLDSVRGYSVSGQRKILEGIRAVIRNRKRREARARAKAVRS
jgi:hypothetical protein